jgi:hypothetical protein
VVLRLIDAGLFVCERALCYKRPAFGGSQDLLHEGTLL